MPPQTHPAEEETLTRAERSGWSKERRYHEFYEWLHIANDFVIGGVFLVGSVMFLYPDMETAGVWLFIYGSAQMLLGPVIRTVNKLHLRDLRKDSLHW